MEDVDCIPPILSQFFEGRSNDLAILGQFLFKCAAEHVFASISLHGFPGAGKSLLAHQLANLHTSKQGGSLSPVLWVSAATPGKVEMDICKIASQLGILSEMTSPAERHSRQEGVDVLVEYHWYVSLVTSADAVTALMTLLHVERRWMIVFDNVSDFGDVKDCWPPAQPGCCVVMTSRHHAIGGTSVNMRHTVNPLDIGQTANLILSILNDQKTPENLEAARSIERELGGLPLASSQIACYIQETGIGLKNFLPYYRRRWKRIHRSDVNLPDYQHYQDTLTNIWHLCSQKIDAKAKFLGELLAFLQPDRIPLTFFTNQDEPLVSKRPDFDLLEDEFE
jgi:hypothetical protein